MKRAISFAFILLSLICSSVGFSQSAPLVEDETAADIHYIEFSQNVSEEFCEGFKIVCSEQERPGVNLVFDYPATFTIKSVLLYKYQNYLKDYRSKKTSQKLYIDFGAIII